MGGATILIAEDDVHFGRQLVELFDYLGHRAVLATDGKAAVTAFREGGVRFLLADLMLPELNGVDLVKAIRALPGGDTVPVMLMSAVYRNPKLFQKELRGLSILEFLPKPLSILDVGRKVTAILEGDADFSGVDGSLTNTGSWAAEQLRVVIGEAPPTFDLESTVDRVQLVKLLIELYTGHHAGKLTVEALSTGVRRELCLLNGYPVWAVGGANDEQLEHVLHAGGFAPQAAIGAAVAECRSSGRPLHEALLARGVVGEGELFKAERERVATVLRSCFAAPRVRYRFDPGDDFVGKVGVFEVNPVQALSQVCARWLTLNDVAPDIHALGERTLVRSDRFRALMPHVELPHVLGELPALLKAGATPSRLFRAFGAHTEDLLRTLWLMLRLGMIESHAAPRPERLTPSDTSTAAMPSVRMPEPGSDDPSRAVLAAYVTTMEADYFQALGVGRSASPAEILAGYQRMSAKFSLSRLPAAAASDVRTKAKELLIRLLEAYETLSDPERRAEYEAGLGQR
jgi:DNA-binding response OmpR family regulator